MRPQAVTETVAQYFFFFALDEGKSFSASLKVLNELERKNWLGDDHRARWIEVLTKWKPRVQTIRPRDWNHLGDERGFTGPKSFDLSLWISFQAAGKPDEIEAVLLSKVLGFSDPEIADGLHCSEGTVRYRVGRGLRHLGAYIES